MILMCWRFWLKLLTDERSAEAAEAVHSGGSGMLPPDAVCGSRQAAAGHRQADDAVAGFHTGRRNQSSAHVRSRAEIPIRRLDPSDGCIGGRPLRCCGRPPEQDRRG